MLNFLDPVGLRLCDGVSRRQCLRVGSLALGGLTLPKLLEAREHSLASAVNAASFGQAKSVIVFGLIGGPPQHETWDPKPDAPAEIRGEFGAIPTKIPGLHVGELMPKTAQWTEQIAVLRAIVSGDNAHSSSGYQMLTGMPHVPLSQESATPRAPNNWPSVGAMVRALRQQPGQLPAAVTLPEHIWNDGNFPWPGQDAGILGRAYHPWLIPCDPSADASSIPALTLPSDVNPARFELRRQLLSDFNRRLSTVAESPQVAGYGVHARKSIELLTASTTRNAFEMGQEPEEIRDRYGRSRFAQSVLLARRLVEAGVSLVQVNWTRIKDQPNQGGWDTHAKHNESLKSLLMPIADQCFTALLQDLSDRGLLETTLVVWFGEFGRTPKFNANAGRDHWGRCFSLALAGGGIRGGVVHGKSDKHAAEPVDGMVRPADLLATIFHCLGYKPETELHDSQGRPLPLSRGSVIQEIVR
jgi:hypothetical protein